MRLSRPPTPKEKSCYRLTYKKKLRVSFILCQDIDYPNAIHFYEVLKALSLLEEVMKIIFVRNFLVFLVVLCLFGCSNKPDVVPTPTDLETRTADH